MKKRKVSQKQAALALTLLIRFEKKIIRLLKPLMGLLARMSLLSLHTYVDLVPDVQYAISVKFLIT